MDSLSPDTIRRRLQQQLEQQFRADLFEVVLELLELRSRRARLHAERVAHNGRVLGQALDLPELTVQRIENAGLVHDLGKLDPALDDLLGKARSLSEEEFLEVQRHPDVAADLLEEVSVVHDDTVAFVRHHHERWDGGGYPGTPMGTLEGEEIPVGARVLCVVDAFDAMLSDRVHSRAVARVEARRELHRCHGTQFDPDMVDAFGGLLDLDNVEAILRFPPLPGAKSNAVLGPDLPAAG